MSTRILSRLQPPDTSYWAIIKLSLPVWISNVAIVGGATLDTLMTGHLGSTDLAAVAIGLAVSVSVFVALVGVMQGSLRSPVITTAQATTRKSASSFIKRFGSPFFWQSSAWH